MNGHKLSGTRQFNRHWQSSELGDGSGGGKPIPPSYPSFSTLVCNFVEIAMEYIYKTGFPVPNQYRIHCTNLSGGGLGLFIDEGLIYFNHYMRKLYGQNDFKYLLPKGLHLEFKDKYYFDSDDLYAQYPVGFHHVQMQTCEIVVGGEIIEMYEFSFDGDYQYNDYAFDDYYIEYDFDRAVKNLIRFNTETFNFNTGGEADDYTYLERWIYSGKPTPTGVGDIYTLSNVKFEDYISPSMKLYKAGSLSKDWFHFSSISTFRSVYDLNNLYNINGNLDISYTSEDDIILSNSWYFDYETVPDVPAIYINVGATLLTNHYEGIDLVYTGFYNGYNLLQIDGNGMGALYQTSVSEADLTQLKMYTYY